MDKHRLFSRLIIIVNILIMILQFIVISNFIFVERVFITTIPNWIIIAIVIFCIFAIIKKLIKNKYMLIVLFIGLLTQLIGSIKTLADLFILDDILKLFIVITYVFSYGILVIYALLKRKVIFVKKFETNEADQ